MDLDTAQTWATARLGQLTHLVTQIPGSSVALRYIRSSYQDDPVRSLIELLLCLFAVRYLLASSYSTARKEGGYVKLSEEEVDELVEEWQPEPLVQPSTAFEEAEREKLPVIVGPNGPKVKLASGKTVTNLASYNYYNLITNEALKEKAVETLRTYGVGPCGPPGFYGTQDVHQRTEEAIAAHIGVSNCIVYAQAFSTISSVIPAFSKRGDIIVADEAVNYAIQKGIQISRSTVHWYKHNDLQDMERVLAKVSKDQARKPLTRRFIITEGLFEDVGDMVDLARIVELKLRYKFRIVLDETWSYGVLGRAGRGLTEYARVDPLDVDIIIGSMAGPLCAGGGFCAGSEGVTEHQRLNAAAFTYSAALPAMLATVACEAIVMLETQPEMVVQVREHTRTLWQQLDPRSEWVHCTSAPENPMLLLVLKDEVVAQRRWSRMEQEVLLQDVVDECLANGVLISRRKGIPKSLIKPKGNATHDLPPALRVCVTTGLSKKEIERAGVVIRHAVTKVVKGRK